MFGKTQAGTGLGVTTTVQHIWAMATNCELVYTRSILQRTENFLVVVLQL